MAGGGPIAPSSSKRRSLDADLNLVPFIDLLSVCICFLLMTAVWIQIGSLQVKQSHGTEAAAMTTQQYELELKFQKTNDVKLEFKKQGRVAKTLSVKGENLEALLKQLDTSVLGFLKTVGGPGKDVVGTAMVTPKAGVAYGDLVSVMDVLRKNKITNLGVVPVKD